MGSMKELLFEMQEERRTNGLRKIIRMLRKELLNGMRSAGIQLVSGLDGRGG